MKKIDVLLRDYQPGHSEFQIRNFIVNSEVHPWHKYNQCLREIEGRKKTLESNKKELEAIERALGRKFGFFRSKKTAMLERQKQTRLDSIHNLMRELNYFVIMAMELRHKFGFEKLSVEKKRYLEADAWREKAKWMICLDMFCFGQISKPTLEFTYKLPKAVKRELIMQLKDLNREKLQNYLIGER